MEEENTIEEVKIDLGELYLDEVNLILSALAKAPFEQVAGLIHKIRGIAISQLQALEESSAEVSDEE
jgi:hypothetical protein